MFHKFQLRHVGAAGVTMLVMLAMILLVFSVNARAAVNLALTCTVPLTADGKCPSANRVFAIPVATTLVAVGATYKPFGSAVEQVLVCREDIPAGTPTTGCPPASKVSVDRCLVAGAACPPAGSNSCTVRWVAPLKNTNDTNLVDLAGFQIYWGTTKADGSPPLVGELTPLKDIADPKATSAELTGLGYGKFYFALTAYNTADVQSAQRSAMVLCDRPAPVVKTTPGQVTGVRIEATVTVSSPPAP